MAYVIGLLVFLLVLDVYVLGHRNTQVFRLRMSYINRIGSALREDNRFRRSWEWRFAAFDSVTYNEMVFKFCVPLEEFYKDKSFLDPSAIDPKLTASTAS